MTPPTKPTKVPGIPKPPNDISPGLRGWLTSVAEALEIRLGRRGDPKDRAITLRELIETGLATDLKAAPFDPNNPNSGNIGFESPSKPIDTTTPPAPTSFTASGAYSQVLLSWDYPNYGNHSFTEIYGHSEDVIGDAQLIGVSTGLVYIDPIGSDASRYYWARHISTSGVIGPWNSGTGTQAETAADVEHLLTILNESITTSELAQDLQAEIDHISGEGEGSVAARIATEAVARAAAITAEAADRATAIGVESAARAAAITSASDALQGQINDITGIASWDSSTSYDVDDKVRHDDKLWSAALENDDSEPTHSEGSSTNSDWTLTGDYSNVATTVANNSAAITAINDISTDSTSTAAVAIKNLETSKEDAGTAVSATSVLATTIANTYATSSDLTSVETAVFNDMTGVANWDGTTEYAKGDKVISGKKLYRAKAVSTNVEPPNADSWELDTLSHASAVSELSTKLTNDYATSAATTLLLAEKETSGAAALALDDAKSYADDNFATSSDLTDVEAAFFNDMTGVANWVGSDVDSDPPISATDYVVGDRVVHNKKLYKATAESTDVEPPNATYWELDTLTYASALSDLTTSVSTAEGNISTNSASITALETTVNDPTNGVSATATGLSTLATNVADNYATTDNVVNIYASVAALKGFIGKNDFSDGDAGLWASGHSNHENEVVNVPGTHPLGRTKCYKQTNRDAYYYPPIAGNYYNTSAHGKTFRVTGYVYNASTVAANAGLRSVNISTNSSWATGAAAPANDNQWRYYDATFTVNDADGVRMQPFLQCNGYLANEGTILEAYWTDMTLEDISSEKAAGDYATAASESADSVNTRIDGVEGTITANSNAIDALEATVDDETNGVTATASALSTLGTSVSTAESDISTNSAAITALETTVNDETNGVVATASGLSALQTNVSDNYATTSNVNNIYASVAAVGGSYIGKNDFSDGDAGLWTNGEVANVPGTHPLGRTKCYKQTYRGHYYYPPIAGSYYNTSAHGKTFRVTGYVYNASSVRAGAGLVSNNGNTGDNAYYSWPFAEVAPAESKEWLFYDHTFTVNDADSIKLRPFLLLEGYVANGDTLEAYWTDMTLEDISSEKAAANSASAAHASAQTAIAEAEDAGEYAAATAKDVISATTQAELAADAFNDVVAFSGNPEFQDGKTGWKRYSGALSFEELEVVTGGPTANAALRATDDIWVYTERKFPVDINRTYRVTIRVKAYGAGDYSRVHGGVVTYDAAGAVETLTPGTHRWCAAANVKIYPEQGWVTLSGLITGGAEGTGATYNQFRTTTKFASPVFLLNWNDSTSHAADIDYCILEDVTEEVVAQSHADAAVQSAGTAETRRNEAGDYAEAARLHSVAAETTALSIISQNIIPDSSFEAAGENGGFLDNSGFPGEAGFFELVGETNGVTPISGDYMVKLTDSGAVDSFADLRTFPITVADGDKFTLGFWAYNNTGGNVSISLAAQGGWCTSAVPSDDEWKFFHATGTASGAYSSLTIDKRSQAVTSSSEFYIDRIILVRGHHDLSLIDTSDLAATTDLIASNSASAAVSAAETASADSTLAGQFADAARGYSTTASTKADNASGFADDASGFADNASGFADTASGHADAASGHIDTAKAHSDDAGDFAEAASISSVEASTGAFSGGFIGKNDFSDGTKGRWGSAYGIAFDEVVNVPGTHPLGRTKCYKQTNRDAYYYPPIAGGFYNTSAHGKTFRVTGYVYNKSTVQARAGLRSTNATTNSTWSTGVAAPANDNQWRYYNETFTVGDADGVRMLPFLQCNGVLANGDTLEAYWTDMTLENISSEKASADFAAASFTSSETAATKAGEAGDSAEAASQSEGFAGTSAGNASFYANKAAESATVSTSRNFVIPSHFNADGWEHEVGMLGATNPHTGSPVMIVKDVSKQIKSFTDIKKGTRFRASGWVNTLDPPNTQGVFICLRGGSDETETGVTALTDHSNNLNSVATNKLAANLDWTYFVCYFTLDGDYNYVAPAFNFYNGTGDQAYVSDLRWEDVTLLDEAVTEATASAVNGINARLNDINDDDTGVTVEEAMSAVATSTGNLEGQYTVKIDANGAVAGFGLASTTTSLGENESEFIVNADRFALMRGGSDTTEAVTPFTVQSTETVIGDYINHNSGFWDGKDHWHKANGALSWADVETVSVASPSGNKALRCSDDIWVRGLEMFPVDINKTYRVKLKVKAYGTGFSRIYGGVVTYDAAGNVETGSPGTHRWCAAASEYIDEADGWVTFSGLITGGAEGTGATHKNFRTTTKFAQPVFILQYSTSTTSYTEIDYCRFEEVLPAGVYMHDAFIKNASITSAKIGTLGADKITTGTLDTDRIGTNSIQASKLVIDNTTLTETTITSGTHQGKKALRVNAIDASNVNITNLYADSISGDINTLTPFALASPVSIGGGETEIWVGQFPSTIKPKKPYISAVGYGGFQNAIAYRMRLQMKPAIGTPSFTIGAIAGYSPAGWINTYYGGFATPPTISFYGDKLSLLPQNAQLKIGSTVRGTVHSRYYTGEQTIVQLLDSTFSSSHVGQTVISIAIDAWQNVSEMFLRSNWDYHVEPFTIMGGLSTGITDATQVRLIVDKFNPTSQNIPSGSNTTNYSGDKIFGFEGLLMELR